MYHYRTSKPEHLAAAAKYGADNQAIHDQADALCKAIGGDAKPLYAFSIHGRRFHSVIFTDGAAGTLTDPLIWTKPKESSGNGRTPRSTVPAAIRKLNRELHGLWKQHAPTKSADRDPVLGIIGNSWGDYLFATQGGFGHFVCDGDVYIASGTPAAKGSDVEEIVASLYESKRKQMEGATNEPA